MLRLFAFFLTILSCAAPALAERATVKATQNDEYIRLMFYCKQPMPSFSTSINGNKVNISFKRPLEIDTAPILSVGKEHIKSAVLQGSTGASLTLAGNEYSIRKFIGEDFIGLDILKPTQASASKPSLQKEARKEAAEIAQKQPIPQPQLKRVFTKTMSLDGLEQGEQQLDEDASASPAPSAAATPEVASQPAATVVQDNQDNTPLSANLSDDAVEAGAEADAEAPETQAAQPAANAEASLPEEDEEEISAEEAKANALAKLKSAVQTKLIFSWNEPAAAASFKRAGYLWLVFDSAKNIDVKDLVSRNTSYFSGAEQIPNRFYTVLRLKLKSDINTVTYKENNDWVIGITKEKTVPAKALNIDITSSILTGTDVILESSGRVKPLRIIDPEVGDEIIILPYQEESAGVDKKHKYVDFVFMETAQGAAVQVISDNVDVATTDTGLSVTGPANRISSTAQNALKEIQEKEEEARIRAERIKQQSSDVNMLKFSSWALGGDKNFLKDLKELEWKITEVSWQEKNRYRLELARFYFAHGLDTEALGVIKIIKEYDEKMAASNDIKMLEATSLYMLGRYDEALAIYNTINLSDLSKEHRKEVGFWQTAAEINIASQIKVDKFITTNPLHKEEEESSDKVENTMMMRDTSTRLLKLIRKMDPEFVNADELQKLEATARFVTNHYQEAIKRFEETDLFSSGDMFEAEDNKLWWSASDSKRTEISSLPMLEERESFLKSYPDKVFNDFNLVALEDALKRNDLAKSEELLSIFRPEERLQQKDSIEFLRGLFYAKDEADDKAIETWAKLITDNVFDTYNRARSQFALTIFLLDKKRIELPEAIARLNSVRDIWRGGNLEFHILKLLGDFYIENKQYIDGFRVWREAISAFPGSDESLLIARKMSENFVKVFTQGAADKMPQIDAISLFYEFRELTPIGKLGDEMITRLVDRLIAVDLLDRASALLTHQVRFRLIGEERDAASTKLVKVHLLNQQPEQAIDVLDATDNDKIAPEIATERKYLRAEALLELGKNNKVLSLLNEDESHEAAFLRADVYWRNKVWRKVVDELETPFREIRRSEEKLTPEETNQVIKLAVAYALIDRQKRLKVLYEDFQDFIDDKNKRDLLTFIATDKGPVDFKNLDGSVEFNDMDNFLKNYMKPAKPAEPGADPAAAPSAQANPAGAAG